MNTDTLLSPPAVVRSAEDLAALAAEINAEHKAGEQATRKGLEHFRAAGAALLKAKAACGHGNWLPWLQKNVKFSQQTASVYMRLAKDWDDKLLAAGDLREAMRILADAATAVEQWRRVWHEAGFRPMAATVPELQAWLRQGLFGEMFDPQIADDDDGYRLLCSVLEGPAASYLLLAGQMLPAPPRPPVAVDQKEMYRETNWLSAWEILVECRAGRFWQWCQDVGVKLWGEKGITFPVPAPVAVLREKLLDTFWPDENGSKAYAQSVVAKFSDEDLELWMRGYVISFLGNCDCWIGREADRQEAATVAAGEK
jgi:hypothetical protein